MQSKAVRPRPGRSHRRRFPRWIFCPLLLKKKIIVFKLTFFKNWTDAIWNMYIYFAICVCQISIQRRLPQHHQCPPTEPQPEVEPAQIHRNLLDHMDKDVATREVHIRTAGKWGSALLSQSLANPKRCQLPDVIRRSMATVQSIGLFPIK